MGSGDLAEIPLSLLTRQGRRHGGLGGDGVHRLEELPAGENRLGYEPGDLVAVADQPPLGPVEDEPCPPRDEVGQWIHLARALIVLGQG